MLESPDKHTHCLGTEFSVRGEGRGASASPAPSRKGGEPDANPTDLSKSSISSPSSFGEDETVLEDDEATRNRVRTGRAVL